jgi:predicted nucleotidyltransferase
MSFPAELDRIIEDFSYPLIFVTVSGAHLYGFESPDSDYDLRGCHVLPLRTVLGLREPKETEEFLGPDAGLELDLVSHDIRKFCRLLVKPNGYVLEQLTSPLVLRSSPAHQDMLELVPELITRHHAHHYHGFARNQWKLFAKEPRVKALLYIYRVLLTGIHLMKTGKVEASLPKLLEIYPQEGLQEWIEAKRSGAEKQLAGEHLIQEQEPRYQSLLAELECARDGSHLPERPGAIGELNEILVSVRI